jgi:hypothetical protein
LAHGRPDVQFIVRLSREYAQSNYALLPFLGTPTKCGNTGDNALVLGTVFISGYQNAILEAAFVSFLASTALAITQESANELSLTAILGNLVGGSWISPRGRWWLRVA